MRGKKFLSVLTAAAMLGSTTGLAALAEGAEKAPSKKKTYNYVALGDSIAAGYGLYKGEGLDPAMIINDKLLADPVQGAYPAIFTGYLKELGAQNGVEVKGTNLAATAFRAEDIEKVIRQEGYQGEFSKMILEMFVKTIPADVLTPYHEYFNDALSEADLVSIQLGGNDIVMSIVPDMLMSENPVLQASGVSLALTLFGLDTTTAMGAGIKTINDNKDKITAESFLEAANYMKNVAEKADELVEQSAEHVKGVVKAVQEVNGETDIALISMFNPYRTEDIEPELTEDIFSTLGPIFAEASDAAAENEAQVDEKGVPTDGYIDVLNEKVEQVTELKKAMETLNDEAAEKMMEQAEKAEDISELKDAVTEITTDDSEAAYYAMVDLLDKIADIEEVQRLLDIINSGADVSQLPDITAVIEQFRNSTSAAEAAAMAQQIAGPIAMQMAGKNVDPQIKGLNEKLKAIAAETGAVYVDVYGISPETDSDPHPNANGHKEIADIMFAELSDMVSERMSADGTTTADEDTTGGDDTVSSDEDKTVGDINGDGKINVTDISLAAAQVKGIKALSAEFFPFADADHSGRIDVTDVVLIAAHVKNVKHLS